VTTSSAAATIALHNVTPEPIRAPIQSGIRDQGLAYFHSRAVKIFQYSDFNVLAHVEGTVDYFAELSLTMHAFDWHLE